MRPSSLPPIEFKNLLDGAREYEAIEVNAVTAPRSLARLDRMLKEQDLPIAADSPADRAFIVWVRSPSVETPSAPPDEEPSVDFLLRSAELLLSDQDYLLARNLFSLVLKKRTEERSAIRGLGICLYRLSQTALARKCFQALYDLEAQPEMAAWLGLCESADGNEEKAIALFTAVDSLSLPKDLQFEIFKELGNCLTRLQRYDEAAGAYEKAGRVKSDSDVLWVNCGTLELQRRHFVQAREYFQRALALSASNPRAHCGMALVSVAKGDAATAWDQLEQALTLDPQYLVALVQLVNLAKDPGQFSRAKHFVSRFLEKEPQHNDAHYLLALTLFSEGNFTSCQNELDILLRRDPSHSRAQELKEKVRQKRKPVDEKRDTNFVPAGHFRKSLMERYLG